MTTRLLPNELIEATNGDAFARAAVSNGTVRAGVWACDGAAIWGNTHRHSLSVVGVGDPAAAAGLLEAVAPELPGAHWISLPRGWLAYCRLSAIEPTHDWEWFHITHAPSPIDVDGRPQWLPDDDDDIRAFLSEAMPEASAWPGDQRVNRWAGIRRVDGELVAALADTSKDPAAGHISSVTTAPAHRRRGYAAALTSWVTGAFLAEGADMVTLGMYSTNDSARRLYDQLGFRCDHRFSSAELLHDAESSITLSRPVGASRGACAS